jgi:hypothetical protein
VFSLTHEQIGAYVRDPKGRDEALAQLGAVTRASEVVAGTGVDPVTPRFSGACSAD